MGTKPSARRIQHFRVIATRVREATARARAHRTELSVRRQRRSAPLTL